MSILQLIPKHWKREIKNTNNNNNGVWMDKLTELLESKKPTKLVNEHIILTKCEIPLDRLCKWETDLTENIDGEDWLDTYKLYTQHLSQRKSEALITSFT